MMRRRLIIAAVCLSAINGALGQRSLAPKHAAGRRLMAWCSSNGLEEAIDFSEEAASADGYSLTLHASHLDRLVGKPTAENLYRELYLRLLGFSDLSPTNVNLKLIRLAGGYCDPSVYETAFTLTSAGIQVETQRLNGPRGIRCMLDFDGIRRYEASVAKGFAAMSASPPPAHATEVAGAAVSAAIKQSLQQKYVSRGATLALLGDSPTWLSMKVTRLRREVIASSSLWERLQIFVLMEPVQNATRIRLLLDGKYGAGLAPPDEKGYLDMEPTYTAELLEYGKKLILELAGVK